MAPFGSLGGAQSFTAPAVAWIQMTITPTFKIIFKPVAYGQVLSQKRLVAYCISICNGELMSRSTYTALRKVAQCGVVALVKPRRDPVEQENSNITTLLEYT